MCNNINKGAAAWNQNNNKALTEFVFNVEILFSLRLCVIPSKTSLHASSESHRGCWRAVTLWDQLRWACPTPSKWSRRQQHPSSTATNPGGLTESMGTEHRRVSQRRGQQRRAPRRTCSLLCPSLWTPSPRLSLWFSYTCSFPFGHQSEWEWKGNQAFDFESACLWRQSLSKTHMKESIGSSSGRQALHGHPGRPTGGAAECHPQTGH